MTDFEFARLVGKYRANIYRLALCYTKNQADAEDVTQDAFLKLYEKQPEFTYDEEVKAWLIRVAANRCKDLLRSHWYKFSEPLDDKMQAPQNDSDEGDRLIAALSKLPAKTRTVMYMYYYEEYSVKEIAKLIGETETAVTSQLWRGRKRLKAVLGQDDPEPPGERVGLTETHQSRHDEKEADEKGSGLCDGIQ